jgi:uncharacterized membrane protein YhaH (DUF805 family)
MKMNWYLMVLKKYAQFSGRSRRKELWMFELFNVLIYLVLLAMGVAILMSGIEATTIVQCIVGFYVLATLIPHLAVCTRRLHDTGRSAFWWLWILVPYVGVLPLIIIWLVDGVQGPNDYGPDPKQV